MLKEKLNESIKIIDKDLDFLATSSTIDVKNIIANSKDLLRIIYFFNSGYYYIARNTYDETHTSLMRYLYFNHIEPEEAFEYDSYLKDVFLLDGICLVATPKDKITTELKYGDGEFNIIAEDGFNYGYEYENHLILFRDFEKNSALDCPLFKSEKLKLYEEFKDEVSEDTLKKRRKYYLTHGITTSGLLESSELKITTPYMLRRDGKLLECGDYHPYIKSYRKELVEETKKYLSLHKDFLEWFYDNTLNEEVRELISNLKYTQEEIDRLWYLTNQEFCRVRTSNYRYKTGGDNGEIYFRISSENFNWFDLIWNICVKYSPSIDYITIMKDPQVFGKQFEYIKIKGESMNKYPLKNFIELGDEQIIESLDEDIEKHDTLNPLLFDENDELKSDIKEAIEKIVNQFVEDLKTDGVKIEVKDVILVGSNVSYNYTKDSDLDIHIVTDSESLDCNPEVYTLLYGAYRSLFNKNYDITIKGIPVEIYVELV